jgi:hypothetical protein
LDYTLKRLGVKEVTRPSSPIVTPTVVAVDTEQQSAPALAPTDIRSLRELKQPSSAVEMAALVAYYLAEIAPEEERRPAITASDLERYFKQANYRLPQRIDMTLSNAAASGYFDRATRGAYKLNPVGFNLITQTLPRGASTAAPAPRRAAPKRSTKSSASRSKK